MKQRFAIEVPYPPTVNNYWRMVRGRMLISQKGREFKENIRSLCTIHRLKPLTGPLTLDVLLYPPDRRRRDIDNVLKSLLDSLQYAGIYRDDNQIVDLRIRRGEVRVNGCAVVTISEEVIADEGTQATGKASRSRDGQEDQSNRAVREGQGNPSKRSQRGTRGGDSSAG